MAGNPDVPDFSESNPEPFKATPPEKPVRPRIKTFSCPACGAPVTVHYAGFSMSAVCESCRSVIDTTDENYNILCRHFAKKALWNPIIPLGTRGKLDGKLWETIGFMVRSDITGRYTWDEYLLFNPYYGYRWLVQDHGHWNFVQTIKQKPFEINQARSTIYGASAEYNGKKYKLFNRGTAKVNFVLGEFYWRVIVDS